MPGYEGEPLLGEAIDEGYGLGVMQRVHCGAQGLATPYLAEIQQIPNEEEVLLIATVKCVANADTVQGSQQVAPAGVLDCSTVVAMDAAERPLLLETMGVRTAGGDWMLRHFKNRSYQPRDVLESPKDATVGHLAPLIGDHRLVVGWRLGLDLASMGIGVSTALAIDLGTDPVVRAFFHYLMKEGSVAKDVDDFILHKPEFPIAITMACALFTGNAITQCYTQGEERDVVRDVYFIAAI